MTGYYLEVGYNSAAHREDVWKRLVEVARELCAHPERIAAEVLRLEPGRSLGEVADYVEMYRADADLTITIVEEPPSDINTEDFQPYIQQLASGGGDGRDLKEACRRAFCRLAIEAMHRERLEINLRVS